MTAAWTDNEDPVVVASRLEQLGRGRPGWLAAVVHELTNHEALDQLARIQVVWDLSAAEMAALLGVSRQAFAKWSRGGVPAERAAAAADLAAGTDLLVRYLKRERIPAVVRRPAERLGGRSLLEVAAEDGARTALEACRAMFDIAAVMS